MRSILILAILAVGSGAATAQHVSTPQGTAPTPAPAGIIENMGRDPAKPQRVTGTILAVDNTRRLLMIERADKLRFMFVVDSKVRTRADKDTAMAGRKDLSLGDYKPGNLVSVSYRTEDNRALEIRLKRPKT